MAKKSQQPTQVAATATEALQTRYTVDVLRRDIAVAAYYRAHARGFTPGGELEDWLAAEREIMAARAHKM